MPQSSPLFWFGFCLMLPLVICLGLCLASFQPSLGLTSSSLHGQETQWLW